MLGVAPPHWFAVVLRISYGYSRDFAGRLLPQTHSPRSLAADVVPYLGPGRLDALDYGPSEDGVAIDAVTDVEPDRKVIVAAGQDAAQGTRLQPVGDDGAEVQLPKSNDAQDTKTVVKATKDRTRDAPDPIVAVSQAIRQQGEWRIKRKDGLRHEFCSDGGGVGSGVQDDER
ncbi:hypothetical protein MMC21_007623 [Puttea exsequens]|nr:hypothetical protein [Puttea exsequens]